MKPASLPQPARTLPPASSPQPAGPARPDWPEGAPARRPPAARPRPAAPAWLAVALGALAAVAGCRSAPPPVGAIGAQPLERPVPRWTDAQWQDGAAQAWQSTLEAARRNGRLDDEAAAAGRLRATTQRLAAAAGAMRGQPPSAPWAAHLLVSPVPDAWCLWGVGCMATSALLGLAGSDDELAAALAHALAHAAMDHARERADALRLESAPAGRADPADPADPADAPDADAARAAARALFELPWRRAHEIEADRLGTEIAARAGFDPRAAIAFWRAALTVPPVPGGPPGWVGRHPAPGNRTADLVTYAQRMLPLWEGTRGIIRSP